MAVGPSIRGCQALLVTPKRRKRGKHRKRGCRNGRGREKGRRAKRRASPSRSRGASRPPRRRASSPTDTPPSAPPSIPRVSSYVLAAWDCAAYVYDDATDVVHLQLRADPAVRCSDPSFSSEKHDDRESELRREGVRASSEEALASRGPGSCCNAMIAKAPPLPATAAGPTAAASAAPPPVPMQAPASST